MLAQCQAANQGRGSFIVKFKMSIPYYYVTIKPHCPTNMKKYTSNLLLDKFPIQK